MKRIDSYFNEINSVENKVKYDYGFDRLNEMLNKIEQPSIITLFSPIGRGKTTFALNMALSLALDNTKVLYITNSNKGISITRKLLSILSMVPISDICNSTYNEEDKSRLLGTMDYFKELDILIEEIDEENNRDLEHIFKEFVSLFKQADKFVIIYDEYLGDKKVLNELKELSKSFNINVIIVARVNTGMYITYDSLLSSLDKELEGISNCVIGLQRKDYFTIHGSDDYLVNVYKVQNGSPASLKFRLIPSFFRFEESEEANLKDLFEFDDLPF